MLRMNSGSLWGVIQMKTSSYNIFSWAFIRWQWWTTVTHKVTWRNLSILFFSERKSKEQSKHIYMASYLPEGYNIGGLILTGTWDADSVSASTCNDSLICTLMWLPSKRNQNTNTGQSVTTNPPSKSVKNSKSLGYHICPVIYSTSTWWYFLLCCWSLTKLTFLLKRKSLDIHC